jgi:hypothetical protein
MNQMVLLRYRSNRPASAMTKPRMIESLSSRSFMWRSARTTALSLKPSFLLRETEFQFGLFSCPKISLLAVPLDGDTRHNIPNVLQSKHQLREVTHPGSGTSRIKEEITRGEETHSNGVRNVSSGDESYYCCLCWQNGENLPSGRRWVISPDGGKRKRSTCPSGAW